MKTKLIFLVIALLLSFSCSIDKNPLNSLYSVELSFEFPTESRPNSITIDENYGFIYISNCRSSISNDSRKIQKFSLNGELLATIVDYANNNDGSYSHYLPIDLKIDNDHNICVLVKPYQKLANDEYWSPFKGFCIMIYNNKGEFIKEFDFAEYNTEWSPRAIAFKQNIFYVANNQSLIKIDKFTGQTIDIPLPTKIVDSYIMPEFFISDMIVDDYYNIWIVGQSSTDNHGVSCHVTKMDSTCTHQVTFNSNSKTSDFGATLNTPGIALDKKGNIYLATFYCKSLEIFNSSGLLVGNIDFQKEDRDDSLPISVTLDKSDNIYVLDYGNDKVYVLKRY